MVICLFKVFVCLGVFGGSCLVSAYLGLGFGFFCYCFVVVFDFLDKSVTL